MPDAAGEPILDALAAAGKRGLTCRELVAAGAATSCMSVFRQLLDLMAAGAVTRLPSERYTTTTKDTDATA